VVVFPKPVADGDSKVLIGSSPMLYSINSLLSIIGNSVLPMSVRVQSVSAVDCDIVSENQTTL
jgi:hypothetical protein